MKTKLKTYLKKGILYSLAISILVSTSAFAAFSITDQKIDLTNVKSLIDEASTAQAVAYIMQRCVGSVPGNEQGVGNNYQREDGYFMRFGLGDRAVYVSTGVAWEKNLSGEADDGVIKCYESSDGEKGGEILDFFAKQIGLSKEQVICNKENLSYPGLTVAVYDYVVRQTGCNTSEYYRYNNGNTASVYGQTYSNGKDYLKILYNHWVDENKERNPYLVKWDQLYNWDSALGYYEVLNEFKTHCDAQVPDSASTAANIVTIKTIEQDGNGYKESQTRMEYKPSAGVAYNITASAKRTCVEMANTVNQYYPAYKDKISKAYANECNKTVRPIWKFVEEQAHAILSGTEAINLTLIDAKDATTTTWSNAEDPGEALWNTANPVAGVSRVTKANASNEVAIREFTEEEKQEAQKLMDQYNSFPIPGDNPQTRDFYNTSSTPWTCKVPDGYILVMENYKDPTSLFEDGSGTGPCYNSGVESMGWILCPAIANGAAAVDGIEQKLRDWLTIDPSSTLGNDTQDIWGNFRDIANIAIIIFFMVIIFSQLTGVGIDNYGIKKMLPKLIAMAILINLSYIICEIAIDISNILGVGLSNLMKNIAGGSIPTDTTAAIVGSLLATAAGVAVSAGTITAVVGVASGGGVMIIISIILALLVALVSVLMFFVMLAARSMIVIIFTVISPVAFALYILPNTQGLFKKWWKVFQAALVVYPICGALYGASYVIKKIVIPDGASALNDNPEFLPRLIAVFAPFVPFLILPTLLKNALAALGMVGGAITMLGSGLKTGLKRGNDTLKGSDRYKAAQERNMERRVQRRAGVDRNGNIKDPKDLGRFGRFWRGGDRGIARARVQYAKNQENRAREKDMMGAGFDAMLAGSEAKVEAQRVADQEALLANGKEPTVNVNNPKSVGSYHAGLLQEYQNASDADKPEIMTKIKAAQNILSKTDKGRGYVQENFENAVKHGYSSSLGEASSHVLSQFGDKYKSVNRGSHAMISDLATGADMTTVENNINDKTYAKTGTDKYTAESLTGADERALDNLATNLSSMNNTERNNIQATAYEALEKQKAGTLNIKPEVRAKLEKIASNYVPQSNKPTISTFDSSASAEAALNEELRRSRQNTQNKTPNNNGGSGGIILS